MRARSIYTGVLSNSAGNVLMLLATLLLTRILDPDQFGEFRVASSFATLCIPFLALGGERIISRHIQSQNDNLVDVQGTALAVLGLSSVGTAILLALYPVVSIVLLGNSVTPLVYFLGILIIPITIAYNLTNTIWRHSGRVEAAQFHLNFVQRTFRAPLLIVSSALWPTAAAASAAMLVAQALSLAHILRHVSRYFRGPSVRFRDAIASNLRPMIVVGIPVAVLAAIDRIDVLIVNGIMGVGVAGSYDVIFLLSITAMFPAMALAKSTEPYLLGIDANLSRQRELRSLQLRSFLLSCLGAAVIGVASVPLSAILGNAGPEFVPATIALSAGLALASVTGPVIEHLQINGQARSVLTAVGILLPAFILLKVIAAYVGSLTGVAAMAGMFYFALRLTLALHVRRTNGFWFQNPFFVAAALIGYIFTVAIVLALSTTLTS